MKLTDTAIKNAKAREKAYKLADGQGMYLEITPKGAKYWRLKYRFHGREKRISLGIYPEVGLKAARKAKEKAREQLSAGIDPSISRKAEKASHADTFECVAREWLDKRRSGWSQSYIKNLEGIFSRMLFPHIGNCAITAITAPELLQALRRIEDRGAISIAHQARQLCTMVFRYAIATGKAERDPAADLKGALPSVPRRHLAALTKPKDIGELLRAIDGYGEATEDNRRGGGFTTSRALRLAPLVFVRPGELRKAEWIEIDLENAEWRIPAEKMKKRRPHIVPLSTQAVDILREIHRVNGSGRYVFPNERSSKNPMSEMALVAALRRMGYTSDQMTAHGFRSIASTLLHEQGWDSAIIELQLAHIEGNSTKAAYNHAKHLAKRREMMQAWADYLDGLKSGADVVPINKRA